MKKFPWVFSLLLSACLIGLALVSWSSAPTGTRWLGNNIQNTGDLAVYFSYLSQGHDGHLLLDNLYAIEPHQKRFDLFWSLLGVVARLPISPIVIHETARVILALVLVFAVWRAATSLWPKDRDATLATILAFGGLTTGWLYPLLFHPSSTPSIHTTFTAPDLASEFSLSPILLGGVHIILSTALLLTAIRLLWQGVTTTNRRSTILGSIAAAMLFFFHPYFAPLVGLVILTALFICRGGMARNERVLFERSSEVPPRRDRALSEFTSERSAVPPRQIPKGILRHSSLWLRMTEITAITIWPIGYYAWLALNDATFREHHLVYNILPLGSPLAWLLTVLPFLIAFIWMWRKHLLPRELDWRSAWILTTIILLIVLPVPWKRKLLEGLIIPCVFLTMPAWFSLRDWIKKQRTVFVRMILAICLMLAAWLTPLNLLMSDLSWLSRADASFFFYQSETIVEATHWIHNNTNDRDLLLSDTFWLNVWLPALSGRRVWIGHDHETPNFAEKLVTFNELVDMRDAEQVQKRLADTHVTIFITTNDIIAERFTSLAGQDWRLVYQKKNIRVWQRS